MTCADGKADPFTVSIEDDVEAFHDDGAHDGTRARLRHCKFVAVLLCRSNVLYGPEILLYGTKPEGC